MMTQGVHTFVYKLIKTINSYSPSALTLARIEPWTLNLILSTLVTKNSCGQPQYPLLKHVGVQLVSAPLQQAWETLNLSLHWNYCSGTLME
jgi:hypothetical protein